MIRSYLVALLVVGLLLVAPLRAATKYQDLEPGWAKRDDVARTLGEPTLKLADVLHEHKPQDQTGPIYVEYRLGTDIVDRIEVKLLQAYDRAGAIKEMALSVQPVASAKDSSGVLVEFYGDGAAVELVYRSADAASGVSSIRYDSDRLFESEVAKLTKTTDAGGSTGTGGSTGAGGSPPTNPGSGGTSHSPPIDSGTPPPPLPPPVTSSLPPSVRRDPAKCYDIFVWADREEDVARRMKNVMRRQKVMDVRLAAQSGDCERARSLADQYKQLFPK